MGFSDVFVLILFFLGYAGYWFIGFAFVLCWGVSGVALLQGCFGEKLSMALRF